MSLKSNKQKGTLPKREEEEEKKMKKITIRSKQDFFFETIPISSIQGYYLKSQSGKSKWSDALYFDLRVVANNFPSLKK